MSSVSAHTPRARGGDLEKQLLGRNLPTEQREQERHQKQEKEEGERRRASRCEEETKLGVKKQDKEDEEKVLEYWGNASGKLALL